MNADMYISTRRLDQLEIIFLYICSKLSLSDITRRLLKQTLEHMKSMSPNQHKQQTANALVTRPALAAGTPIATGRCFGRYMASQYRGSPNS